MNNFNNKSLEESIQSLPKELQKRIYIFYYKLFWRNYVPLTAKPPSWLKYANYIQNKLWEAQKDNIHFLHLPFNTLPENKKWIMGCQCNYCSKIKYKYKRKEYIKLADNIDLFYSNMQHYGGTYMKYLDDYDPFCGSVYEDQDRYELRTNTKTKFDNTLLNYNN